MEVAPIGYGSAVDGPERTHAPSAQLEGSSQPTAPQQHAPELRSWQNETREAAAAPPTGTGRQIATMLINSDS